MSHSDGYIVCCAVEGNGTPFSVIIDKTAIIDQLKKKIIKEKTAFTNLESTSLNLYHVDIPDGSVDEILASMNAQTLDSPVRSCKSLISVFPTGPKADTVHFIVKRNEESDNNIEKPKSFDRLSKLLAKIDPPSKVGSPSKFRKMAEGSDPQVRCNRPMDDTTIPLPLLHPIFGEFVDGCRSFNPGPEENAFVRKLSRMADYFTSESNRREFFNDTFAEYYRLRLSSQAISGSRATDGHAYVYESPTLPYIIIFVEGKNEFVGNSADPRFQAVLYYREYLRNLWINHKEFATGTCFPVILMTYCGPNIQISGGVTHPDGTIQSTVLTPWFPLDGDWNDNEDWARLAGCLGALRDTLVALSKYYISLPISSSVPASAPTLFPYPEEYEDIESRTKIKFNYIQRLYQDVLLFSAKDTGKRSVFIKFVKQYSETAHRLLSTTSHAPILYGLTNLPGGWIMVIMEELKAPWELLGGIKPKDREPFKQSAYEAVNLLHARGYVHGDIRASNILVCPSDPGRGIKFIDFDEAGLEGEATYPRNLNTVEVTRPEGASDGKKILKKHDLWMMQKMFAPEPPANSRSICRPVGLGPMLR